VRRPATNPYKNSLGGRVMKTYAFAAVLCAPLWGCATSSMPDNDGGNGNVGGEGSGGQDVGGQGGTGNAGGQGGTGNAGGQGGSGNAGGMGGSGGSPYVCGDAQVDPGESCDMDNFDGKGCQDFGLGPGSLQCNQFCQLVVSACAPPENCLNGFDDDGDGDVDCQDSDCSMLAQCIDSCASPVNMIVPAFQFMSTAGRPDVYQPTCTSTTGAEMVFTFTAAISETLYISVDSQSDMTLAITTACGDTNTEIACVNNIKQAGLNENLQFQVTQGQTYFVVIDSATTADAGDFFFELSQPFAFTEQFCGDLWDDDYDGLLDCDDPDCQGSAQCSPGANATGTACAVNSDCSTQNLNDPICLPSFWGFTNGYCSEFCNKSNDDCGGSASCYDYGISQGGVCLDNCNTGADCSAGYDCVNLGLASNVCYLPPESSCTDGQDNDFDNTTDCEDSDCTGAPDCVPGAGAVGTPCAANNQCSSNAGGDPICFGPTVFGPPGGYCSEFCNLGSNDCAAGAACVNWWGWPSGNGNCFQTCVTQVDCPNNTFCGDIGAGQNVCFF
jgi:hypothetical protein